MKIVRTLVSPGSRDRIHIIADGAGLFRLQHERHYRSSYEGEIVAGWGAMPPPGGIYDSIETAEADAHMIFATITD